MYTSFRRISVHFVSISFSFYEKDLSSLYYDSLWMNGTFKLEKVLTKVMKKNKARRHLLSTLSNMVLSCAAAQPQFP